MASVILNNTNVALEGAEPFQMTPEQMTVAIQRYARKHDEYARTVRQNTDLRRAAIMEWVTDGRPAKR